MRIRDDGQDSWPGDGQPQPHEDGQHRPNRTSAGPEHSQPASPAWGDAYRYHTPQPGGATRGGTGGATGGATSGATGGAMSPDSERNWAIASHLTGFISAYAALGFIGPLVCLVLIGDRSPFARHHAVEALNFNITWLVYIVVCWVLTQILVGWLLLAVLAVAYFVLVVRGAMAASRSDDYRYPLTLRFVS